MAVYRETPKCPHCGRPTAKAVRQHTSSTFIGDNFLYWDRWLCECEGAVAEREKMREEFKPAVEKYVKSMEKAKKKEEKKKERIAKKLKEKAEYRRKMRKSIKSKLNKEELKYLGLDE